MKFRLVDRGWGKEIDEAMEGDCRAVEVICPFIQVAAAKKLLAKRVPKSFRILTRFNLRDFSEGVSDPAALRMLLAHGAEIRGIRNLHTKLYLLGKTALITSANLTTAALSRNHEFGCVSGDAEVIELCKQYFDGLWDRANPSLVPERIDRWEQKLAKHWASAPRRGNQSGLGDEGADLGLEDDPSFVAPSSQSSGLAFVKFFGEGNNRADLSMPVFDEIDRCGSHWACAYPQGKRPQNVLDGAIMYLATMTKEPNDARIIGRAIGMAHVPGRDDATDAEVRIRPWKARWPHYVRLHHAEFVSGALKNGVSLAELKKALGANAFRSTQEHFRSGVGNTNPNLAYQQQPAVELTAQSLKWLNDKFDLALDKFGGIEASELATLDWPKAAPLKPQRKLPAKGQNLLRNLLDALRHPSLDIDDPRTFPTYKATLTRLGIAPKQGQAVGGQFQAEGGLELNNWLADLGLPALTGLVVRTQPRRPGDKYFTLNRQEVGDMRWWMGQVRWARKFDWEPVLNSLR